MICCAGAKPAAIVEDLRSAQHSWEQFKAGVKVNLERQQNIAKGGMKEGGGRGGGHRAEGKRLQDRGMILKTCLVLIGSGNE